MRLLLLASNHKKHGEVYYYWHRQAAHAKRARKAMATDNQEIDAEQLESEFFLLKCRFWV
jgi:hypothetical protein